MGSSPTVGVEKSSCSDRDRSGIPWLFALPPEECSCPDKPNQLVAKLRTLQAWGLSLARVLQLLAPGKRRLVDCTRRLRGAQLALVVGLRCCFLQS